MSGKNRTSRPIQDDRIGHFHDRVGEIVRVCGTVSSVAKAAGVSESVVRKWRDGISEPSTSHLVALASAAGVSLVWLATGEGPMRSEDLAAYHDLGKSHAVFQARGNEVQEVGEEYALVPLYDVRAAAGHGAVVEEEQIIDSLAFKRQWIQQELHASPGDLYLIYVDGESMEPTLRPGDVILVDRRSAQAVPRDGIYVLRMDGSLLVKRLQRLPGRQVKVTSDNPAYEPFNLSLETPGEDLAIVGRVVWTGRRM